MKDRERKYTTPDQYFHNFEHDPEGRTHCRGSVSNPYRIVHYNETHIINTEFAKGHGKSKNPQWFKFTKRKGKGFLLSSGELVNYEDTTKKGRTKVYFTIDDKEQVDILKKVSKSHVSALNALKSLVPQRSGTKNSIKEIMRG